MVSIARAVARGLVPCCALLLSCSHFRDTKAVRFERQEDVGSVHVAVQSVAPFEGYINSLQPQFTFNTEQAIAAAIQQTQTEDSQLFRALLASASLSLPQVTESSTKTTTDGTVSTKSTETRAPGESSKVTAAAAAPANALGALSLPGNTVGLDQSLKFRAAAALLQEVALLNAYVRDAAISRGARPYVVRMLVTLLPHAHLEPYDAYSTISFFETERKAGNPSYLQTAGADVYEQSEELRPLIARAQKAATERKCAEPLEIIPLLVTDNLEASLHSDTVQRIRDMSAALQGFVSNAAAGASVRSRAEDAAKTLNQNLNSLFTIARVAPNAVEARLGAVSANGRFVMVSRTFNVTVILLVPTAATTGIGTEVIPCPSVTFTASTRIRDAERGTLLPSDAARMLDRELAQLAANRGLSFDKSSAPAFRELVELAEQGDFKTFQTRLAKLADIKPMAVWNDFVTLAAMTGRSGGTFQIPLHDSRFFSEQSMGTLLDDGTATVLALNGGSNILGDRIRAVLRVERVKEPPLFLNDTKVAVGLDGRSATVTFPSIHVLLEKKSPVRVFVSMIYEKGTREWQTASYERGWYPMHKKGSKDVDDGATHPIGSRFREDPIPYVFIGDDGDGK